jgi:site-specific recombinase XerD
MSFSAKTNVRPPARADGTTQVRMQVILDSVVIPIGLGITWPAVLYDEKASKCLTKLPAARRPAGYEEAVQAARNAFGPEWEKRADDNNLLIGQALARANDIFVEARLAEGAQLTKESFLSLYKTQGNRTDFLVYMETQIKERFRRGLIKKNTVKNHNSTLHKLQAWRKKISFASFDHRFADDFDTWLKRTFNSDTNTRWCRHKDVKTYLALAKRDRITFEDPYIYFRNKSVEGSWRPLQPDELVTLEAYYKMCAPGTPHRRILQKFLFSCHSALRLGDLKAIGQAKLEERKLTLKQQKTYHHNEKELLLPLTRRALRYLQEAQEENETEGFFEYADAYSNRQLKEIAGVLGIRTKMHYHVGRETFATNFIRMGGKVEVLQKLMGHTKLSMTMKYVHVDEQMKQDAIDALDAMDPE